MTEEVKSIKLDIGCGPNPVSGYIGVDAIKFEKVEVHMNVVQRFVPPILNDLGIEDYRQSSFIRWPWDDNTVDDIHCSHFVEHLTREEWIPFFNEAYRVLKPDCQIRVITPHWSNACAYGDPTHKSFLSERVGNYLNKEWRASQAPHTNYTCDFLVVPSCSFEGWVGTRHAEVAQFAVERYVNSARDLILTCKKRVP